MVWDLKSVELRERKADKALYLVKAARRDRLVLADNAALTYELQLALDAVP